MKMKNRQPEAAVSFDMTPMIDIVFQLLIFFVMTFKIVVLEGDFSIRMPLGTAAGVPDVPVQPLKVRLTGSGNAVSIQFENREIKDWDQLRTAVVTAIGGANLGAEDNTAEIELDCDYDLSYRHVIEAITACTGRRDSNGYIQKLVDKIKFAPPRAPKS